MPPDPGQDAGSPQVPSPPTNELATRMRAKYPGAYDDLDDGTLTQKVIAKYPQYSDLAPKSVMPGAVQTAPGAPVTNAKDIKPPAAPPSEFQKQIVQPAVRVGQETVQSIADVPSALKPSFTPEELQKGKDLVSSLPFAATGDPGKAGAYAGAGMRRVGRLAGDALNVVSSPFNLATASIQQPIQNVIQPWQDLARRLYGHDSKPDPETGRYTTGNQDIDKLVDNAVGAVPFIMTGKAIEEGKAPSALDRDIAEMRQQPRAAPEPEQMRRGAPASRQLPAAPKEPIVTPTDFQDRPPAPTIHPGTRNSRLGVNLLPPAPIEAPAAKEAQGPIAPRAEITGRTAEGKPIYGSGPAKIVGYRADGKTPIYEGYENEPEKPKGRQKAPTLNGKKATPAEGAKKPGPEGTNGAAGAARTEAAPNPAAELKILRDQMADLNRRIGKMNYGANMKAAIAKYRDLEARAEKLAPAPKEVMAQTPTTSRATPTAKLAEPSALPPEIKADIEKQVGRPLTDEEAIAHDRANLERGMATAPPGNTNEVREAHREETGKEGPTSSPETTSASWTLGNRERGREAANRSRRRYVEAVRAPRAVRPQRDGNGTGQRTTEARYCRVRNKIRARANGARFSVAQRRAESY